MKTVSLSIKAGQDSAEKKKDCVIFHSWRVLIKPPTLLSPPSSTPKNKEAPRGLNRAFMVITVVKDIKNGLSSGSNKGLVACKQLNNKMAHYEISENNGKECYEGMLYVKVRMCSFPVDGMWKSIEIFVASEGITLDPTA